VEKSINLKFFECTSIFYGALSVRERELSEISKFCRYSVSEKDSTITKCASGKGHDLNICPKVKALNAVKAD
jgi:hypothetical protein